MKPRVRLRRVTALGAAVVVAAALSFETASSVGVSASGRGNANSQLEHSHSSHLSHGSGKPTIAEELAKFDTSRVAEGVTVNQLIHAAGAPSCTPPPIPAATYPPGHNYGVPFLAAITGGQILFGYDEWVANNTTYVDKQGKTFHLNPWLASVFDISGWVTGLLQLPSLNAKISAADVVLCDADATTCENDGQQPGCIYLSLAAPPLPPSGGPPPVITDVPPPGKPCYGSPDCIPYSVALTPVGTTSLTVTGVQPDGALNLSVTTSAVTTISLTTPNGTLVCQNATTTIPLTTQAAGLPAGSPIPPTAPNLDYRSLQTQPAPLTGPLASASSTVASNNFKVPAFPFSTAPGECSFAQTLNGPLGGWNTLTPKDPPSLNNNYYDQNPLPSYAGLPGWGQFKATTTVVTLGLPVGPPSNFNF